MTRLTYQPMTPRRFRWKSPAIICRALFTGCLLCVLAAFAFGGSPEETSFTVFGGVSQPLIVDDLMLLRRSVDGEHQVCPQAPDDANQPFCRRFDSPMLGACGYRDEIYLVLANGDLHHVNNALIGAQGGFDPVFHPDKLMELSSVWMPELGCSVGSGLPEVIAISSDGSLVHFNGETWRSIGAVITSSLNRVGGGITPAVLPHHRTYGSVYGGSCSTFEPMVLSHQRYQSKTIKELLR